MTDGFGREITYLRISVTELCNLRCRYCMPAEGVCKRRHEDMLTQDELVGVAEAASSLGIRKIRITGGEPLVKHGIVTLCRRMAEVPGIEEVCLTTNGTLLPELAKPLRDAGVTRLNISLDSLKPERYTEITRGGDLNRALAGIEAARAAGFERIKLNCVLIGGFNGDEIPGMAALTRDWGMDVRFIELMPMVAGEFGPEAFVPVSEVLEKLPELSEEPPDGGVARLYRLPGANGCIGLISPVSRHFCARCNRLRLTADGKLKPCLHSAQEFPVKGLGRAAVTEQIKAAVMAKPAQHGVLSASCLSGAGRSMNRIGG